MKHRTLVNHRSRAPLAANVSLHKMPRQITTTVHSLLRAWGVGVLSLAIFAPRAQALAEVTLLHITLAIIASLAGVSAGFVVVQSSRMRQILLRLHPFHFSLAASLGFLFGALAYAEGLVGLWPFALWFFPACALETLMLLFSQVRKQSAG